MKKMKKLLFAVLFFIPILTYSQFVPTWVSTYSIYNYSVEATCMCVDGVGNIIVGGFNYGLNGADYKVIKYSPAGTIIWEAGYGFSNSDKIKAVTVDKWNNVYVTGSSYNDVSNYDILTIKYNASGVKQWHAIFNGSYNWYDDAVGIKVDISGNVYIGGLTSVEYRSKFLVLKYNSSGLFQWSSTYGGSAFDYDNLNDFDIDFQGNSYLTGSVVNIGSLADYGTVKFNSAGQRLWYKTYNGNGNYFDGAASLVVDGSGNVIVTGTASYDAAGSDRDIVTIKYNSGGDQLWLKSYHNYSEGGRKVLLDSLGNVYVAGNLYNSDGKSDYLCLKYSSAGTNIWAKTFSSPGNFNDDIVGMDVTREGYAYLTGISYNGVEANSDYLTICFEPLGSVIWQNSYNSPANLRDWPTAIDAGTGGQLYVTGYSYDNTEKRIITTLKFSTLIGINPLNSEVPLKYELKQNYPNPFNPSTRISFSLPHSSITGIEVFDVSGKLIEKTEQQLSAGNYEFEWDGSKYSSGTYFYRITSGGFTETKKMILIK